VKGGKTVIAFVEDPDGYKFELIERGPTPEPLCQVMLRVGDLDRAINFYEKVRHGNIQFKGTYSRFSEIALSFVTKTSKL
jgi:catechol 2,3-dioxygenase-like lactoylglutathione lyase family enzyme